MKLSALCIMNLVNLWHRILSISSACLILMLRRIELTDDSIRTRSFSLRDIVRGFSRTSFDVLDEFSHTGSVRWEEGYTLSQLPVCCAVLQPVILVNELLCEYRLLITCDEKFSRVSAAVRVDLTAAR